MTSLLLLIGFSFGITVGVVITAVLMSRVKRRPRPKYVPIETMSINGELYIGYSYEDLKECRESHYPGDCPLCGAN